MHRFICGMIALLPTLAFAQAEPSADAAPSTRPNGVRRSRAAEAVGLLGEIDPHNEADLQRVVEVVQRQVLGDSRLLPCDLHVKLHDGRASLDGYCLIAEQKSVVLDDLRRVGLLSIEDRVAVGSLGGDRPFAIVQNEAISVTAQPGRSEQLTVWPAGALLFLLQQQGDAFLALGPDGYAGYVEAARLQRVSAAELKSGETKPPISAANQWTTSPATVENERTEPPIRAANQSTTSPAMAENERTEPPILHRGAELDVAISSAAKLLGTKYVWGGIDARGIDCSGLTRCAFESIGVHLPRDADQQVLVGRLVATRWYRADLRRGDLLFFAGRRGTISHVALYLGDDEFLEAAESKVQFSSFNPASPNYRSKRVDSFCMAKRILE